MKQLLFLLLLFSVKSFSQSIDLGNIDLVKRTHFVEDTRELYVFYEDSISVIDLNEIKEIRKEEHKIPKKILNGRYSILSKNGSLYFLDHSGGGVYKLENNTTKGIDRSYIHKMWFGSSMFVKNDTLFRYGGYGFWSMRNFFTYYDDFNIGWEIVSPYGSSSIPQGSSKSTVVVNNDDIYVYGGDILNPFEPKEYLVNKEVWKFDYNNREWKLLGESDMIYDNFDFDMEYRDNHIFTNIDDKNLYIVDVINNNIKTYNKSSFQYGLSDKFDSFYMDGVFYCLSLMSSKNTLRLITRNEDEFFGQLVSENQLYYNNEKIYIAIITILLILISIFSYFRIKKLNIKRNKIIVTEIEMIYKRRIIPFDVNSIKILNLFFQKNKEVFSSDIMDIVENKDLNHGHNTRVKNNLIDEINLKFKSLLGVDDDLITFQKSSLDKRIKVYILEKKYFYFK